MAELPTTLTNKPNSGLLVKVALLNSRAKCCTAAIGQVLLEQILRLSELLSSGVRAGVNILVSPGSIQNQGAA